MLVLDEVMSALDTGSEKSVQEVLMQAGSGRTMVAVAHRLSMVRGADWIYVVDGGSVVESGTHEELLGKGSGILLCVLRKDWIKGRTC